MVAPSVHCGARQTLNMRPPAQLMSPTTSRSCSAEPVQRALTPSPRPQAQGGRQDPGRAGLTRGPGCKPPAPPAPGALCPLSSGGRLHGVLAGLGGRGPASSSTRAAQTASRGCVPPPQLRPGPGGPRLRPVPWPGARSPLGVLCTGPWAGVPLVLSLAPVVLAVRPGARRHRSCSAHRGELAV